MKGKQIILVLLFFPMTAFSQQNLSAPMSAIKDAVISDYNNQQFETIYDLTDTAFRQVIHRADFTSWLKKVYESFGEITANSYAGNKDGFYLFNIVFASQTMQLYLAMDNQQQINGFAIRPAPPQNESVKSAKVPTDNAMQTARDSLVEKFVRPYIQQQANAGISIGIIQNNQLFIYDYGTTDKQLRHLPDKNTLYEIGSITKTFTATLLAELVLEGKCNLDDPAEKFLPDSVKLQYQNVPVTLQELANHTSGLPRLPDNFFTHENYNPADPYSNYTANDLLTYLKTVQLNNQPGTHFEYSNLGAGLLGYILTRISGLPYAELLQKYILHPLNMTHTYLSVPPAYQAVFAQGYDEKGNAIAHWNWNVLAGCGAIHSTIDDMLKYLQAHLEDNNPLNKVFRLCEHITFKGNTFNSTIGLGWIQDDNNPAVYWHNGGTGGFRSFAAYDRDNHTAIIILSNSASNLDEAGWQIFNKL
jgi:CubicO group peptidase (beta-lactamase class C family)